MEALEVNAATQALRPGSAVFRTGNSKPAPAGACASRAPSPSNPALLENFAVSAGGVPAGLRSPGRPANSAGHHMPSSSVQPGAPCARPAIPWAGSLAPGPARPALVLHPPSQGGDPAQSLQRIAFASAAALSRATQQPPKQQGTAIAAQSLSQLMAAARPAAQQPADAAAAATSVKHERGAAGGVQRPTTPAAAAAGAVVMPAPALAGPQPPSPASILGKRKADGALLDQPAPRATALPAPAALALGVPMLPHLSAASAAPVLGRPLASVGAAGLVPAAQASALHSSSRGAGGGARAASDDGEEGASAGVAWGGGQAVDAVVAGEARKARLVWTQELHNRFINALSHLGLKNAVPKSILAMMNVEGMSRENVASHLQKYRLYLRRLGGFNSKDRGDADALQRMHEQNVQAMAAQLMQQSLIAMQGAPPGLLSALSPGHTHHAAHIAPAAACGAAAPAGTLATLAAAALHFPPLADTASPAVRASRDGVAASGGQGTVPWLLPLPGHVPPLAAQPKAEVSAPSSMPAAEDAGALRTDSGSGGTASAAIASAPAAVTPGTAPAVPAPTDPDLVSAAAGGASQDQLPLPGAEAQVGSG